MLIQSRRVAVIADPLIDIPAEINPKLPPFLATSSRLIGCGGGNGKERSGEDDEAYEDDGINRQAVGKELRGLVRRGVITRRRLILPRGLIDRRWCWPPTAAEAPSLAANTTGNAPAFALAVDDLTIGASGRRGDEHRAGDERGYKEVAHRDHRLS